MQMKPSIYLIFNPVSGQGNPDQELAMITSLLEPEFDLDVQITTPETTASDLANRAVELGATALIASGGDGTISAVAEALIS